MICDGVHYVPAAIPVCHGGVACYRPEYARSFGIGDVCGLGYCIWFDALCNVGVSDMEFRLQPVKGVMHDVYDTEGRAS